MAREQRAQRTQGASSAGRPQPSAGERKGKRAHDENGNVRPADGRWALHEPKDESKHVRTKEEGKSDV